MECKKRCKKLCVMCEHYYEEKVCFNINQHRCKAYVRTISDCVTGNINTDDGYCNENKNGNCKKFKLNKKKELKMKLIELLDEYNHPKNSYNYYAHSEYANVEHELIDSVIECLKNNGECDKFDITFEFDKYSGDMIYVYDPRIPVKKENPTPKKKKFWTK